MLCGEHKWRKVADNCWFIKHFHVSYSIRGGKGEEIRLSEGDLPQVTKQMVKLEHTRICGKYYLLRIY